MGRKWTEEQKEKCRQSNIKTWSKLEIKQKLMGKNNPMSIKEYREKARLNHPFLGKERPEMKGSLNPAKKLEVREKISKNRKGKGAMFGAKNPAWKGGMNCYLHGINYYLKKSFCESCGITERLHIHITGRRLDLSNPTKNYTSKNPIYWKTQCINCHAKLDLRISNNEYKFRFITTA